MDVHLFCLGTKMELSYYGVHSLSTHKRHLNGHTNLVSTLDVFQKNDNDDSNNDNVEMQYLKNMIIVTGCKDG